MAIVVLGLDGDGAGDARAGAGHDVDQVRAAVVGQRDDLAGGGGIGDGLGQGSGDHVAHKLRRVVVEDNTGRPGIDAVGIGGIVGNLCGVDFRLVLVDLQDDRLADDRAVLQGHGHRGGGRQIAVDGRPVVLARPYVDPAPGEDRLRADGGEIGVELA